MTDAAGGLSAALSGRYRLDRELGQGGMATVYLAHDLKHDRQVAIKVLKPELAAVLGAERFVQEIKTTALLQHPNILPLFDSGEAAGFLYYVMPFVEGETLREKLNRETQLGVEEAVKLTTEVADALEYAHQHGVIHRDIKPENILLHAGRPLVADFGIALAVSAAAGGRMTETGLSLGTPHYMSPEQATAEKQITARSDIYSLGAVLYEMLTGNPPHVGASAQQILMKIVTDEPQPVTALRKAVPPNVGAAVAKALEKVPGDRFASAVEFMRALDDTRYRLASDRSPPVKQQRRAWKVRAAWGVALAGWILAGVLLVGRRPQGAASSPLVVRTQILLPDTAPLTFAGPGPILWQSSLALSRDGRWLAYSAWEDSISVLYLRNMTSGQFSRLPGTEGAYSPFFSPDGQRVGFFSGYDLKTLKVSGGQPVLVGKFTQPVGAAWTHDDRIFVAGDEGRQPTMIAAAGGQAVPAGSSEPALRQPSLLPGDDWVVAASFGGRLILVSLVDERWYAITRDGLRSADSVSASESIYGSNPQYVASGYILYLADGDVGLMALPFDGKQRRVLGDPVPVQDGLRIEGGLQQWGHFAVSDDGVLVYAPGQNAGMGRLALLNVASGTLDTLDYARDAWWNPRASRDGQQLMLTKRRVDTGVWETWILASKGAASDAIDAGGPSEAGWAWFADGKRILVGGADLFTLVPRNAAVYSLLARKRESLPAPVHAFADIHPGTGRVITGFYGNARLIDVERHVEDTLDLKVSSELDFSRDGRWLAFRQEDFIRVTPWPGRETVTTVSQQNSHWPTWAPDQSGIYYWSGSAIWFVPLTFDRGEVRPGSAFSLRRLPISPTTGWPFDVMPDGRLVVVLGPPERSVAHLEVVHNFFEVLSELAPGAKQR